MISGKHQETLSEEEDIIVRLYEKYTVGPKKVNAMVLKELRKLYVNDLIATIKGSCENGNLDEQFMVEYMDSHDLRKIILANGKEIIYPRVRGRSALIMNKWFGKVVNDITYKRTQPDDVRKKKYAKMIEGNHG